MHYLSKHGPLSGWWQLNVEAMGWTSMWQRASQRSFSSFMVEKLQSCASSSFMISLWSWVRAVGIASRCLLPRDTHTLGSFIRQTFLSTTNSTTDWPGDVKLYGSVRKPSCPMLPSRQTDDGCWPSHWWCQEFSSLVRFGRNWPQHRKPKLNPLSSKLPGLFSTSRISQCNHTLQMMTFWPSFRYPQSKHCSRRPDFGTWREFGNMHHNTSKPYCTTWKAAEMAIGYIGFVRTLHGFKNGAIGWNTSRTHGLMINGGGNWFKAMNGTDSSLGLAQQTRSSSTTWRDTESGVRHFKPIWLMRVYVFMMLLHPRVTPMWDDLPVDSATRPSTPIVPCQCISTKYTTHTPTWDPTFLIQFVDLASRTSTLCNVSASICSTSRRKTDAWSIYSLFGTHMHQLTWIANRS